MTEEGHIVEVTRVGAERAAQLRTGVNIISGSGGIECKNTFLLYKDETNFEQPLVACRNKCKHQGGRFDIEDSSSCVVKCTKHGWELDMSTLAYTNPPDSFFQEQLVVEENEDGSLSLYERQPPQPWELDVRPALPLQPGELVLTYFTHACFQLKFGPLTVFFDPWLTGPAFLRGWWLMHEPPADWLDQLAACDAIYISHLHSDHLSYETLARLVQRRKDIPIYVGDLSTPVFLRAEQHGLKHQLDIRVCQFDRWVELSEDLRFMILMDGVHPAMDTAILLDYKGHLILNTVDCTCPNGARLPTNVDVMMSDFAGGASGFPMTFFGGRYTEQWKEQFIANERQKLLYYKAGVVGTVMPKLYIPFAGYFVEAHPGDEYLRRTNKKNDPADLCSLIDRQLKGRVNTWRPLPGGKVDVALLLEGKRQFWTDPPPGTKIMKTQWRLEETDAKLMEALYSPVFQNTCWPQQYFEWAGFSNYNLVLRVVETDEHFAPLASGWNVLVDFSGDKPLVLPALPGDMTGRNYLEVRVRAHVFRYTVLNGELWDGIYIGFQSRITRDPDIFHFKFWDHFQINLPLEAPDWSPMVEASRKLPPRAKLGLQACSRRETGPPNRTLVLAAAATLSLALLFQMARTGYVR